MYILHKLSDIKNHHLSHFFLLKGRCNLLHFFAESSMFLILARKFPSLGSLRHDASFILSCFIVFVFIKVRHDASFSLYYLGLFVLTKLICLFVLFYGYNNREFDC
ncbi:hypothetical protein VPH35_138760 [Triticum aestivum]